jgi:hypothetical protein
MSPGCLLVLAMMLSAMTAVPAHTETIQITMDRLAFSPKEINASVGDTIEWVNNDFWLTPGRRETAIGMWLSRRKRPSPWF